jgi:hypothetical protein
MLDGTSEGIKLRLSSVRQTSRAWSWGVRSLPRPSVPGIKFFGKWGVWMYPIPVSFHPAPPYGAFASEGIDDEK